MIKLKAIERESKSDIEALVLDWAKKATPIYDGKYSGKNLKVAASVIAAFYDTDKEVPSYCLSNLIEDVLIDYIHKRVQCSCFEQLDQDIKDKFENLEIGIISYCYLTAINIPEDFPIEQHELDTVEGYKFSFVNLYPEKFRRIEGDGYKKVLIYLDAGSPDIAFHKAHQFLLTKIAIWSLLYTKNIFSLEDEKSLNPFGLGKLHTLHIKSSGEEVREYIEPDFVSKPPWLISYSNISNKILSESIILERKLYKLKYAKKIIDTTCNYLTAANGFNNMYLLNELWTVIELLNKKEKPKGVPKEGVGKKGVKEKNTAKSAILRCCKSINRDEGSLLHSARIIRNISTHDTYKSDYAKYMCQELCKVFLDVLIYHSDISNETSFDEALPKVEQEYRSDKNKQFIKISL